MRWKKKFQHPAYSLKRQYLKLHFPYKRMTFILYAANLQIVLKPKWTYYCGKKLGVNSFTSFTISSIWWAWNEYNAFHSLYETYLYFNIFMTIFHSKTKKKKSKRIYQFKFIAWGSSHVTLCNITSYQQLLMKFDFVLHHDYVKCFKP
jgi:hypothetical protein